MSVNLSGSGSQFDDEQQIPAQQQFQIYGMFFCGTCKNVMTPVKEMNDKLQFKCKKCDKKQVSFKQKRGEQCIIYNKQLKPGAKIAKAQKQFVLDPTIPKVRLPCPQCGNEYSSYIMGPDDFQSCIQLKMICANQKFNRCDYTWSLPANIKIEGLKVIGANIEQLEFKKKKKK